MMFTDREVERMRKELKAYAVKAMLRHFKIHGDDYETEFKHCFSISEVQLARFASMGLPAGMVHDVSQFCLARGLIFHPHQFNPPMERIIANLKLALEIDAARRGEGRKRTFEWDENVLSPYVRMQKGAIYEA